MSELGGAALPGLRSEQRGTSARATREGNAAQRPPGERINKQSAQVWGGRHTRLRREHRMLRLERRYRRMLALYPAAHRAEHADEMVGVLLAGATESTLAHVADISDLLLGAARIWAWSARQRYRERGVLRGLVRDERWRDALAVTSVVAPLLVLVLMLAQFGIPQAVASSVIGHPYWPLRGPIAVADWPLTVGAPLLVLDAFAGMRRVAGLTAVALAVSQLFLLSVPAQPGDSSSSSPAIAFSVLLALTAAAGLLLSPGAPRGLAVLHRWGVISAGIVALILGGFSLGGFTLSGYLTDSWATATPVPGSLTGLAPAQPTEVTGAGSDLLIASVIVLVSVCCLFTGVGRRVLALFAISMIPFAYIWADKLASDLIWSLGGIKAVESSGVLLYLPSALVALMIVAGTRLGRRARGCAGCAGCARRAGPDGCARRAGCARPFRALAV